MGTIGGKISFVVWLLLAARLTLPMMDLFVGPCFLEEGCGRYESLWLVASFAASLALAGVPALILRYAINRLATRRAR
jgi:RsiW-degrading membrane proteinase PrsW (M82 family)